MTNSTTQNERVEPQADAQAIAAETAEHAEACTLDAAPSAAAEAETSADAADAAAVSSADAATSEDAPDDVPTFAELGLSDSVLAAVADLGYETPSPVQAQAIPHVLAGRDVLAAAQTGTGKTAAFLLPTMSTLPRAARHHGPTMLVVTPTRELAQQIEDVCETVAKRTHHSSVTVVGGVSYNPQKSALRRGCDILVATPGRLVDLIEQGCANLSEVQVLVLDEADRMLDMGFLPAMRKIVGETPETRQTLLFSATLDEKAIGGIRDLVQDPAVVEIAHKGTVADTVEQYVLPVSLDEKNGLLAQVLKAEGPERVIVFCRTKHRADTCCKRLRRAEISCAPIHGDRSQAQRERALRAFREGRTDVLVATDVLARGIDVSDVRYVINFDVPMDAEDYIHRIGRTGRAGEMGWALTFVTVDDFDDLRDCERLMGMVVPTYPRAEEFELGDELPELDPDRSVDPASKGGRKRKRGGRRRGGATGEGGRRGRSRRGGRDGAARTEATVEGAAPARGERSGSGEERREGSQGSRRGSGQAKGRGDRRDGRRDGASKQRRRNDQPHRDIVLTEAEERAIMRTRGDSGATATGEGRRRNNRRGGNQRGYANDRRGRGGDGRGSNRRDEGRDARRGGGRGGDGRGDGRPENGAKAYGMRHSKRRVGDRQGRNKGIY